LTKQAYTDRLIPRALYGDGTKLLTMCLHSIRGIKKWNSKKM
jgi:hypothetical protein